MPSLCEVTNSNSTSVLKLGWNGADQCTSITNGALVTLLQYDGLGHWVRVTDYNGASLVDDLRFVWSGNTLVEERDATGTNVVKRFYANGFQQNGTNFYYLKDHLGSILEVTDANGNSVARFSYDPYGNRTQTLGTLQVDYGFAGLFNIAGLDAAVFRIYDPTTARWNSRDPIGETGGWNLYAYCGGNPMNYSDVLGSKIDIYMDPVNRNIVVRILSAFAANKSNEVDWDAQYGSHTFVIVAHSSTDTIGDFSDIAQLVRFLARNPTFKSANRVLLIACDTGKPATNGEIIAKKLAQAINLEVIAPTDHVSVDWFNHLTVDNHGQMKHFLP